MIPCANINVQAVWPTTVVSLLYSLQLLLCTLPPAQYEFNAAYMCVGGGGGGIFSVSSFLSLSAPLLSRSLPHSSLALCPTPLSRALVLCIPTEVIFLISTNPAHTTSLFWVFTTHRVSYCLCNTVITFPETDFIFGRYSSLHTPCICVPWVPSRAPCYSDAYPEQSGAKRQSRWTAMINVDL